MPDINNFDNEKEAFNSLVRYVVLEYYFKKNTEAERGIRDDEIFIE